MAATYAVRASGVGSIHPEKVPGSFFDAILEITGDSSYPAGGYALGIAQLQTLFGGAYTSIESIEVVNPWFKASATISSFTAAFNKATGKVLAMAQNTAGAANPQLDVTAGTDLSAHTCSLRVRFY